MYKYTPKKEILHEMYVRKVPGEAWWDTAFRKHTAILTQFGINTEYRVRYVLSEDYPNTVFFSSRRVREVPVRGFLFPVEMFDEDVEK